MKAALFGLLAAVLLQAYVDGQCPPDNLSCPRDNPLTDPLECYQTAELCNGVDFCDDGTDEGGVAALDCGGIITGGGIDVFVCGNPGNENILDFSLLCDGNDDCQSGLDETTSLCFDKCSLPYYGGCQYTRQCVSNEGDTVICGQCLAGFITNTITTNANPCLAELTLTGTSPALEDGVGPWSISITLSTPDPNRPLPPLFGSRVQQLPQACMVTVDVTGGTATPGGDYQSFASVTVTFNAESQGPQTVTQTFTIFPDADVELDETIVVMATVTNPAVCLFDINGSPPVGSSTDSVTLTIVNDDVPPPPPVTIGWQQTSITTTEGSTTVVCAQVLAGLGTIGTRTFQVDYEAQNGQAVAPGDFPFQSGSFTFSAAQSVQCFNKQTTQDNVVEANEVFSIELTDPSGQADLILNPDTAFCTIEDDDAISIGFTQDNYLVGEAAVSQTVCAQVIVGSTNINIPVTLSTSNGAATDGNDYTGVSNFQFNFPPGSSAAAGTTMCVTIAILEDVLVEGNELFNVVLNSALPTVEFFPQTATVTILDNDIPQVGLQFPTYAVDEDQGTQLVCAEINNNVVLIGGTTLSLTISTSDCQDAQAGNDYVTVSAPIEFNVQNQNQFLCVSIGIINDLVPENEECLCVNLVSNELPGDLTVGPVQSTVCITDNDEPCVVLQPLCSPMATCTPQGLGRICVCDFPYVGDGFTCESPCVSDPCDENAICERDVTDVARGFSCTCMDPYVGSGEIGDCMNIVADTMGDDPHFSIILPSGEILCYTVQGEHGFTFNLISSDKLHMNAMFVPDSRREEVTWLGSIGLVVKDTHYQGSNVTKLQFNALTNEVHIGDKVTLHAKHIETITIKDGKLTISEAAPKETFSYPSVEVNVEDAGLHFTIKFTGEHLDMFWHGVSQKTKDSHGLIGQFFRKGVEIDTVRKLLILPGKEPVPVMRRPVWSFMEREARDDQLCWTAMNPGYQGKGLIDGTYLEYLVNDVLSSDFSYMPQGTGKL